MTDYNRMVWQYRANRTAEATQLLCLWVFLPPEVMVGLYYHFPWWDTWMIRLTAVAWLVASFIDKRTRMYRLDL